MVIEKIRSIVDEVLNEQPDLEERRCGYVHLYGVSDACALLAVKRGANPVFAMAAGMLHDIWAYKTGDSRDHAAGSAREAKGILQQVGGFSSSDIEMICDAIAHHSHKGSVDGPLAELLKDADVLQHYLYDPGEIVAAPKRLSAVLDELGLQPAIFLSAFQPEDQIPVKALILSGLQDHWGSLDPTKNPDLNDIAASYRGAVFLVARQNGRVIGSGALVPRSPEAGEVVRMSVAAELRGQGIGSQILTGLLRQAQGLGLQRVILETTETWTEVIAFYQHHGFQITHYLDGDVYFSLELGQSGETHG